MAIRKIVLFGDDILRKKSREVTVFDEKLATLLDDMAETMHENDGLGLAAPQVGILKRVVVIDIGDDKLVELINPVITEESGLQSGTEGCLSCPGEYGIVERPNKVTAEAFNRHGKRIRVKGEELMARAICHEVDHLDGKIFIDIAIQMVDVDEDEDTDDDKNKK